MSSLRQLLASYSNLLLLDPASSQIQIGWLAQGRESVWRTSSEEAGIGVFTALQSIGVAPQDCGAFLFCEGPGSILGIRTVAAALRSWQVLNSRPVFAYCSLALIAEATGRDDVGIIADARRESWHYLRRGSPLRRVTSSELSGDLLTPQTFRNWSPLPPNTTRVPYEVAGLLPQALDADLFHETKAPDAFLHEEPSYVTWTPQIHRAPQKT